MCIGLVVANSVSLDEIGAGGVQAKAEGSLTRGARTPPTQDPMVAFAPLAATSRIGLMTRVVPIFQRHATLMAQEAVTLQGVARGRLTLGGGLSQRPAVECSLAISFERPAARMRGARPCLPRAAGFRRRTPAKAT